MRTENKYSIGDRIVVVGILESKYTDKKHIPKDPLSRRFPRRIIYRELIKYKIEPALAWYVGETQKYSGQIYNDYEEGTYFIPKNHVIVARIRFHLKGKEYYALYDQIMSIDSIFYSTNKRLIDKNTKTPNIEVDSREVFIGKPM
jgi:hypothetical protein